MLQDQAQRRRMRIIDDRINKVRYILSSNYRYREREDKTDLLTAFVDLLVDVYHLAEQVGEPLELELATSLAAQLYKTERASAVAVEEPPEAEKASD